MALRLLTFLAGLWVASRSHAQSVHLHSFWVTETVAVQTDGAPEPGETLRLTVRLWNPGTSVVTGLTGTAAVRSPATGVTLPGAMTTWPDLAPGSCEEDAGTLLLSIASTVACGSHADLDLTVTSASGPPVVIPISLEIGGRVPAPQAPVPKTATSRWVKTLWNGTGYGLVWSWDLGGTYIDYFQALDDTGSPLGPALQLPSSGSADGPVSLTWAGDRWAMARAGYDPSDQVLGQLLTTVDRTGALIRQERIYTFAADSVRVGPPEIAWDGVGLCVVFPEELRSDPSTLNDLVFLHASLDGVVDVPPERVESDMQSVTNFQRIAWTGKEAAVLCNALGGPQQRVLRFSRQGDLLGRGAILPNMVFGSFVWNGHGFALAGFGPVAPVLFFLDEQGNPLGDPVQLVAPAGYVPAYHVIEDPLAFDGAGYDVGYQVLDQDASLTWAVMFHADPWGRVVSPPIQVTPAGPDSWSVSTGCAANTNTGEVLLPVVHGDSFGQAASAAGDLQLVRVPLTSACPTGEPPSEVSGPGSGSPLKVTVEYDTSCAPCGTIRNVVAHFQDLGPAATAYNTYQLVPYGSPYFATTDCGRVLGTDATLASDGPGRLRATVEQQWLSPPPGVEWGVICYLVTASNAQGEGSSGLNQRGVGHVPFNGCLSHP